MRFASTAAYERRAASIAFVAFSLYLALLGGEALAAKIGEPVIVVNNVTGVIQPGEPGKTLVVGVDVFSDETVKTAADSETRLMFADNTTLTIGEKSEITLDKFVFDPDDLAKSKVAVSVATDVVRFATGTLPKEAYDIRTPNSSLSVRGTVFNIDVDSHNGTLVIVEDGVVLFSAGGVAVQVNAGQSSTVHPGGTPSTPTKGAPSRSIDAMHHSLKQALASPGTAQAFVKAIEGQFSGGAQLTNAIGRAVEEDPDLAQAVVDAAQNATPAVQQALGSGLADAALYFANDTSSADAAGAQAEIQAAIASSTGLTQTAAINGGGATALTTTLTTTNPTLTTQQCSSNVCP